MSNPEKQRASELLREFKGDDYAFGEGALDKVGGYASELSNSIAIISGRHAQESGITKILVNSIEKEGITLTDVFNGAQPNAPLGDVYRLAYQLSKSKYDGIVTVGGGSCIDASKAALTLTTYGGMLDDYFGNGKISAKSKGIQLPLIAVQTASSSAAHLTKYSNITNVTTHQKRLIVDESIIPKSSIFQYDVTMTMPPSLTKDGGLDGIAHCWEVWMGSTGKPYYNKIKEIASLGIKLIVKNLFKAVSDGKNIQARYSLGLGTDLGGYAIMVGGTSGAHLGSFSVVDILTHGRACGILNPYYTVFFSRNIQDQLRTLGSIFQELGFINEELEASEGLELGKIVARGMIRFTKSIGAPTTLKEVGATEKHLENMLSAAKDPKLKMKLLNMPVPLNVERGDIDKYMKRILEAAMTGDLELIKIV